MGHNFCVLVQIRVQTACLTALFLFSSIFSTGEYRSMWIAAQGFEKPNYTFTAGNSNAGVRVSHVCPGNCTLLSLPSMSQSPPYYTCVCKHAWALTHTHTDLRLWRWLWFKDQVTAKCLIPLLTSSSISKKVNHLLTWTLRWKNLFKEVL